MKKELCLYGARHSCQILQLIENRKERSVGPILQVEDILYLQDIFLTKGLHYIKVKDILVGRKIVGDLLKSMHYYRDIACITNYFQPALKRTVYNIYCSLVDFCGTNVSYESIEEFFLENFFADFMWIEYSEDMLQKPLVVYAMQAMQELEIVRQIPIIVLSYA